MYRALVAIALLLGAASQSLAGDYKGLAIGILEMNRGLCLPPAPSPVNPTPAPSSICDNCNGRGKVGDGTVMLTCPVCNGSGKKVAAEAEVPEVKTYPHYPLRGNWWSGCPNWTHLTVGPHKGKFDPEWLKGLSNPEIQSLHSDDHDGRVKWEFAVRGTGIVSQPQRQGGCPAEGCPPSRSRRGGLMDRLLN